MKIKLPIDRIAKEVEKKVTDRLEVFMIGMARKMEQTAPVGPVNTLKKGFDVERDGNKVRIINAAENKGQPYALDQTEKPFTHVPRGMVGKKGWQDFGARIRPGIKSAPMSNVLKQLALYNVGLRDAHERGVRPYLWDYRSEAFRLMGGKAAFKKALRGE